MNDFKQLVLEKDIGLYIIKLKDIILKLYYIYTINKLYYIILILSLLISNIYIFELLEEQNQIDKLLKRINNICYNEDTNVMNNGK